MAGWDVCLSTRTQESIGASASPVPSSEDHAAW